MDPRDVRVERTRLRRILDHLRPHARDAAGAAALILLAAAITQIPALLVKRMFDEAIPTGNLRLLFLLCGGYIAAPLAAGVMGVGQRYLAARVGERVMFDLRVDLFRHLHKQPLGYFATARPGEALSSVLNDVQGVGSVMSGTIFDIVQAAARFSATLALFFVLDWRLALVAAGFVPLFALPASRVGRKRKQLKRRTQARMAEFVGILAETLSVSGALLLKVFATEKQETRRVKRKARELMELSLQQTLLGRWFTMMLKQLETLGPALIYAVGGYLAIRGGVRVGTLVAFAAYLPKLYGPASDLAGVQVDLITSYAYFDRVFKVLDLEPAIRNAPDAVKLAEVGGALAFRNVSFAYPGGGPALSSINLDIDPGQTVALVGPSGAGKSTLAGLVARLVDPTEGAVLLDGIDLRKLKIKSLRSRIGVVTQETFLFHTSVLENLRYGRPDATQEEVDAAARAAQIHDLIVSLPEKYETLVGDRGYRLSGGERQRLAIARAILRDPRILILDEATSALDSRSEALVQAALDVLMRGRTSLVIAHRLSTIRHADLIVVLDAGRMVERGSHDALLAAGGLYARLWNEQAGAAPAAPPPQEAPARR